MPPLARRNALEEDLMPRRDSFGRSGTAATEEDARAPAQLRLLPAEAGARLQGFNAALLASHSATATLEQWRRGAAAGGPIRARRMAGPDKAPTREQRERLEVGREEIVLYRRVELLCGGAILSEAENWYVPSRLSPGIRAMLETSDMPFGRAIIALHPVRKTFAVEIYWRPAEDTQPAISAIPWRVLQHRALVHGPDGRPFSEVNEFYTREILAFGADGLPQDKSTA
ncbi:hypothetical protein CR492_08955 [Methylocella silvestris]|uniref:Uncharacterized protein n=2 Tax=Methylocella silvestris TaxID=199596 RepID=A0A2J7THJ7_METSI|nr:hypothetical protein CR492_08955 [Methylocella silvestris]